MFHIFFNSLARSRYLSFFSRFILWSTGTAKSTILPILFFCWLLLGLVLRPRLDDPCVCESPIEVYVSFSRTNPGLCIYHLFIWCLLQLFWKTYSAHTIRLTHTLFRNFLSLFFSLYFYFFDVVLYQLVPWVYFSASSSFLRSSIDIFTNTNF